MTTHFSSSVSQYHHLRLLIDLFGVVVASSRYSFGRLSYEGPFAWFFTRRLAARYGVTPRPPYFKSERHNSSQLPVSVPEKYLIELVVPAHFVPDFFANPLDCGAPYERRPVQPSSSSLAGSASKVLLPRLYFPRVRLHGQPELRNGPWLLLWDGGTAPLAVTAPSVRCLWTICPVGGSGGRSSTCQASYVIRSLGGVGRVHA